MHKTFFIQYRILTKRVFTYMEQIFSKLEFITNGEGFIDITNDLNLFIEKNNFDSGFLNLTSLHTSCSYNWYEVKLNLKILNQNYFFQ